jgi:hypothetical protein
VAISVAWQTVATGISSSTLVYTTPAATASTFGYARDLVINNSGSVLTYVSLGASGTSAAAATSFAVPSGGSVVLTQCGVPNGAKIYAFPSSGTTSVSVGYATNVAYI